MRLSYSTLTILLGLSSMSAIAAQDNVFQHEASLGYEANSEELGDGIWEAKYRYFASPVSQDGSPYALNSFMAQTSNLGINYTTFDVEDRDNMGIDGTYVFDSKWFVGLNYQRNEIGNFDFDTYGVEVGYYLNDHSSISAFYDDGDDSVEESYGLKVRSFVAFESTSGMDLGASWLHTDSDNAFNLDVDWYINNSWSIGAGYVNSDLYDGDFDIRTAYWLRISDSISANFAVSKVLDSDADGLGLAIAINGRF
ncbi:putative porin [Shewanella sp. D64]|uniref:putative porin n=1 Tax=unclassified Shewanella TaxID=196818 RepID=UPI0022BA4BAB|nr:MULTISPECIES: putative porin [unclassified Shewanella]MEC4724927.1 putative porin [Shewanella sp. D64]MEC4736280.1 putative porin [Shewanella sp. E94]WBJ97656.1 putative porin [Shewanella sp. MTB7]